MSNLALRKTTPTGDDVKSAALGTMLRQRGFHEVNQRRTFLQDNIWIKKHPEEEKDEYYSRVVLNRCNSHDALDRKTNERDEPKATISRYRSDDSLDRSLSAFRSPESTESQPGNLFSTNATNTTASASATTPVKKKRQSWFPPPPPGYNATASPGASRRKPGVHPPIPPKPSSPVSTPNLLRQDNRQICPPKPGVCTETNRSAARNTSEELDNLIKMNKSLNRARSLENLIYVNPQTDKGGKGSKDLDNVIKVNPRTGKSIQGNQDLDNLIKVNPLANKRNQDLDKLIKVNPETVRSNQRNQDLDSLIKVNPAVIRSDQSQDLEKFIKVKPSALRNTKRDQDLENLTEVNSNVSENKNGRLNGQVHGSINALNSQSTGTTAYSYETRNNLRSVIERDMCTYCRKPLGIEAKMILEELQICCHSTCFKVANQLARDELLWGSDL
ncbi:sciellin [Trichechus manatus latirostris]|uniref:Sciellin n=1 Tax=Trichechus manatus latirostris TaxID=127582 RepID=A0A2Y9FV96_TRIMA|nr:sciellin [Trichechus manatus latirostris]